MIAIVETPRDFVESLAALRFPEKTDRRLQDLMDRNTDGALTPSERDELESLAELSETMSLFRSQAMQILGRRPL